MQGEYQELNPLSTTQYSFWPPQRYTLKGLRILSLGSKWLSIVQMSFLPCILFSDISGNTLTTENNFMISFFLFSTLDFWARIVTFDCWLHCCMLLFSNDWDDAIVHMFIKLTSFPASCHLKTILESGIRIQSCLDK